MSLPSSKRGRKPSRSIPFTLAEQLESRRLFAAGDLDPTFSGDGRQVEVLGTLAVFNDVAVQSDGKIVAAGYAKGIGNGVKEDGILVRYNVDGTLDASFGQGGVARLDMGGLEAFGALVILPNGKIVAGGQKHDNLWLIVRFKADGTIDAGSGFGGADGIQTGAGASISNLAVHNGKIFSGFGAEVRRHNGTSGNLDQTFDGDGILQLGNVIPLDGFHLIDFAVQPDGKIVLAGTAEGDPDGVGNDAADYVFAAARITFDGALDGSFGDGGVVRKGFDPTASHAVAVAIRATDGAIALAGIGNGRDAQLLLLNADGSIDDDLTMPSVGGQRPTSSDVLFDADGRIVVVGEVQSLTYVARAAETGGAWVMDGTFAGDGVATLDYDDTTGTASSNAYACVLAPSGAIVVVGTHTEHHATAYAGIAQLASEGAGIPIVGLVDGTLVIGGTSGDDRVTVTRDGDDIVVTRVDGLSGVSTDYTFDAADVTGISFDGGDGADVFAASGDLPPITANGGAGNDTLVGGDGADLLGGNAGKDRLFGGAGDDRLNGHGGHDRLYGEGGKDRLYGGDGNDSIDGGTHDDRLYAGAGNDTLFGQSGNDRFDAVDSSVDSLFGGSGSDTAAIDEDEDVLESIETTA